MELCDMRKSAGFDTQLALAKKIGATREAVAQWEIGATCPRPKMLIKLADALSIGEGEIIKSITTTRERRKSNT